MSKTQFKSKARSKGRGSKKGDSEKAPSRSIARIEHKFYDTFLESHDIGFLGNASNGTADPSATSLISTVPRGDSASQRDGKQIDIDTVIIEGVIQLLPTNTGTTISEDLPIGNIFLALVEDHQTNGATPTSQSVWTNPSGGTQLMACPFKNLLNASRFTTHKVWRLDIPEPNAVNNASASTVSTQGLYKTFHCYLNTNIRVNFNGGAEASVENTVDNSLHFYCYTNTTMPVLLNYNARIRYRG